MLPVYNLDKIKFATDGPTFERAINLYEDKKVTQFQEKFDGYSAIVIGTHPYRVSVSKNYYDQGDCECYLGQKDILCKHMVAVAIYAIIQGKPLTNEDKKVISHPACSGQIGTLNKEELATVKKTITNAMRYIKPYNGPSRIWFAYQGCLQEGCSRLAKIVSDLPVSQQTAKLLIDLLLRLDKKLSNGVDDSDGIVGGFIEETVSVFEEYIKLNPTCAKILQILKNKETIFGWEESLLKYIKKNN